MKFLLSVDWNQPKEQSEAMNLLHEWEPIELEQALALLTGFFSLNDEYSHLRVANPATPEIIKKFKIIRNLAVECLKTVGNEKLDPISL